MRWKTLALLLSALVGSGLAAADLSEIRSMVDEGKSAQALSELEELLAESPANPDALFLRGLILAETRQEERALEHFEEVSSLRPDRPEPLNNLAVVQAARGDYEAAVETLKEALRTHPAYRTAYENLTKIYGQLASEAYSRALSVDQARARDSVELVLLSEMAPPEAAEPHGAEVRIADAAVLESPEPPLPVATVESASDADDEPQPAIGAVLPEEEPLAEDQTMEESAEAEPAGTEPIDSDELASAESEVPIEFEAPVAPPVTPDEAIAQVLGDGREEAGAVDAAAEASEEISAGELADLVEAWAQAWSEQRVDDYLYFYGRGFVPVGELGREDWEASRRQRITAPEFIKVSVAFLDFEGRDAGSALVRFNQSYESNTFSDVVTKTLELAREDGIWKIVSETVDS